MAAGKVSNYFERSVWPLFIIEVTPTNQQHGATHMGDENQIRNSNPQHFFFSYTLLYHF
jgi:hypothetical protein